MVGRGVGAWMLFAAWTAAACAQEPPRDPALASGCGVTPAVQGAGGGYPGKETIVPSNKPALPAGKGSWAPGDLVYFSGRVLDERCVPVSDATVEIWQTDAYGEYRWIGAGEQSNPYPAFAGSGRAVTDNLGRYSFITVFPGPYGNRAPHIHLRVEHEDFDMLNTEIFFKGDRRNAADQKLGRLPPDQRSRVMATVWMRDPSRPDEGVEGYFDIVLKGYNDFRRF